MVDECGPWVPLTPLVSLCLRDAGRTGRARGPGIEGATTRAIYYFFLT